MDNVQEKSYGKIYRLTNKLNGKMYHGQTTEEDINDRWKYYKRLYCKKQIKLYNALKKHGPENFLFEIIDTSSQNQTQLDDLEIDYIARFDSMNNGYNIMPGGAHGKHSEETKRKISKAHIGIKYSEESKNKMSKAQKGRTFSLEARKRMSISGSGERNVNFGKPRLEETKRKISEAHMGKIVSEETKRRMSEAAKKRKKKLIPVDSPI